MTRVVLVGNYVVPYTTETYLARAFEENGCEVERISQDDAFHMGPRRFLDLPAVQEASLITYTRTHNATALGPDWTAAWETLRERGVETASIHLDRFWDLEREHLITGPEPDPLFTTGHVFTADGGNDERWKAAGVRHFWSPPAVDRFEAEEMPGRVREEYAHDVVFTGSGSNYHGAYPQRNDLIAFLHARYGDRFAHYGHGGGRPVVRMQDLNDLYASARVVVGDSCFANGRPEGVTNARYWSDRVPEVTGRGGVLIHPYVEGLLDAYQDGAHLYVVPPGDWDALGAEIDQILQAYHSHGFENNRRWAKAHALADHTYTARAAEVLRVCGLSDNPKEND